MKAEDYPRSAPGHASKGHAGRQGGAGGGTPTRLPGERVVVTRDRAATLMERSDRSDIQG